MLTFDVNEWIPDVVGPFSNNRFYFKSWKIYSTTIQVLIFRQLTIFFKTSLMIFFSFIVINIAHRFWAFWCWHRCRWTFPLFYTTWTLSMIKMELNYIGVHNNNNHIWCWLMKWYQINKQNCTLLWFLYFYVTLVQMANNIGIKSRPNQINFTWNKNLSSIKYVWNGAYRTNYTIHYSYYL